MRSTHEDRLAPEIYHAVGEFIGRCLRNRKSLFLNDDDELCGSVWTAESTEQLIDLFIESPDESKRSFIVKLRDQLEVASPSSVQLLVELAWFHFLIAHQSSMLGPPSI